MRIFVAAGVALFALFILLLVNGSRCEYYVFKNVSDAEENGDVSYIPFSEGYIKYSTNGIEYQKKLGTAEWNSPVSSSHPFVVTSKNYALLGDRGGNTIMLFDSKGEVKRFTLKYPLVSASVSDTGITEVILGGERNSYLQVYDKEFSLVAEFRTSVGDMGFPMSAAISPDGTRLAVSFFQINGMKTKSSVVFYDLSLEVPAEESAEAEELSAGFDYDDIMIPRLEFLNKNTLVAVGDGVAFFYRVSAEPTETAREEFDRTIESVFSGKGKIGFVLDNSDDPEGRYELVLYNSRGSQTTSLKVDMNYETIEMHGSEIYAYRGNVLTILSTSGRIIYQGSLDGGTIQAVIPIRGWRAYRIIFRDKTADMHLRFWSSETEKKPQIPEKVEMSTEAGN
ncbi:MAG: hypothetical protein IJH71_02815 [Eubacterium sp.]|nr:hypothetical protein [Eubacterium sp.]